MQNMTSVDFDNFIKLHTMGICVGVREQNCQNNGLVWIVDSKDYPKWLMLYIISPMTIMKLIESFFLSQPIRVKKIVFLNSPLVLVTAYNVIKTMVPLKIKKRVVFYRSEWSSLFDHVPREGVPEEYGGSAGSITDHESQFCAKLSSYSDHFIDDNRYGFPSTT
ncbi:hypothetical protein CHUAL_001127 [Chamberlinius hualienensis]